jgi:hypothetical protein
MPTSGLYKVDAILLEHFSIWNGPTNTIYYTTGDTGAFSGTDVLNATALTTEQAASVANLLAYVSSITGVSFVAAPAAPGTNAIAFCTGDIAQPDVSGICYWSSNNTYRIAVDTYSFSGRDFFGPGGRSFETLLHEVGHALGLDHPDISMPAAENNCEYTLMSPNGQGSRAAYSQYDLLALSWLYGGDGVGGTWGTNSTNGPTLPPEAYPPITHTISAAQTRLSEDAASYSFTVTRAGNVSVATTVAWAITGAVDAADFGGTLPSGVVSFGSGELTKTVTFNATNDELAEADEVFAVTLGARTGNGAILGDATSVTCTLVDDDTPPVIHISSAQVSEGNAGSAEMVFTVSRTGNLGKPSDVNWSYVSGSASADDFAGGVPAGGTVSFAAGESSRTIAVGIAGDTRIEPDETFFLQITPTRFGTAGTSQGQGLIVNDDVDQTFSIAARSASLIEGHSGTQPVEFVVTRSGNTSAAATVGWAREGSIGADDLVTAPANGSLSFGPGQTSQIIRFDVRGDTRVEGDESLTIRLVAVNGLGAGLGTPTQAATTVISDDPKGLVTASIARTSVNEGAAGTTLTHSFTLTRGGNLADAATIAWSVGGDVTASDFAGNTLPSGTASFAAGAATTTVTLITSGDALHEADEALTLVLGEGDIVTASPTQGSATVTLVNDDLPNEYRVAISGSASINEGSAAGAKTSVRLTVTRVGDLTRAGSVDYVVEPHGDVTVDPSDFSTSGSSYPTAKLNFAAGESSKTVYVYWLQDKTPESNETFTIALRNGVNAVVSATQGAVQVTIVNDDALPTLAIAASATQVSEGDDGLTTISFDITRTGNTSAAASVQWTLDGSGANPADEADFGVDQAMSGSVSFAAGQTRQTITVQVQGDTAVEPTEAFTLRLVSPVAAALSPTASSVTVQIVNDDASQRTIAGTDATNEKLTLHGERADYAIGYDPGSGHVRIVDSVAGRDGEIDLVDVEALVFAGSWMRAAPDANQLAIQQLGQLCMGTAGGMTTSLWGWCIDYVHANGVSGLGVLAAQAIYGSYSAAAMANAVMLHLGVSASTLGGDDPGASYSATQSMLTSMFNGDANVRGQALVDIAAALGALESDPVYGAVATAYNDRLGAEWIEEFAADAVTLAGLPSPLVEVSG